MAATPRAAFYPQAPGGRFRRLSVCRAEHVSTAARRASVPMRLQAAHRSRPDGAYASERCRLAHAERLVALLRGQGGRHA